MTLQTLFFWMFIRGIATPSAGPSSVLCASGGLKILVPAEAGLGISWFCPSVVAIRAASHV